MKICLIAVDFYDSFTKGLSVLTTKSRTFCVNILCYLSALVGALNCPAEQEGGVQRCPTFLSCLDFQNERTLVYKLGKFHFSTRHSSPYQHLCIDASAALLCSYYGTWIRCFKVFRLCGAILLLPNKFHYFLHNAETQQSSRNVATE